MSTGGYKAGSPVCNPLKQFRRAVSTISILILICSLGVYLNTNPYQAAASSDRPLSSYSTDTLLVQIFPINTKTRILEGVKLKKSMLLREGLRQTRISIISDHYAQIYRTDSIKSLFYDKFLQVYLYMDRPPPSLSL